MHWVKATHYKSEETKYINLDAVVEIAEGTAENHEGPVTLVYLGGMGVDVQGRIFYAMEMVKETPEELFNAEPVKTSKPIVRVPARISQELDAMVAEGADVAVATAPNGLDTYCTEAELAAQDPWGKTPINPKASAQGNGV